MTYDFIVVGAGLSGSTIAHKLATEKNKKVLVIDKRDHIGGNCYDYIDTQTGVRVSKYGPHFFHTNDEGVWNYVTQFGKWVRYDHRTIAKIGERHVPVPVTTETINLLCDQHLTGATEWLAENQVQLGDNPKNSEDIALQRVGTQLYEALFKPYTIKQWAKEPAQLDPSVLARIPVRDSWDNRYFTDKYQALPADGYTSIFEKMLDHPNISVQLNTEYNPQMSDAPVIFTGRIDAYFSDSGLPALEYRSLNFDMQRYYNCGYKQRGGVVNYPSADVPYTRSVEYKWFPNTPASDHSVVVYETSCDCSNGEEPYYPVPAPKNQELYEKYKALAAAQTQTHFIGRLASYKYFNMDQAIRAALDYYTTHFL